jgi:predicted metal-dependent hydrolase
MMEIKIIRSAKRAKTVSARTVHGVLEILAPAHLSDAELQPIIAQLQTRIQKRAQKQHLDDSELTRIATRLNKQYFHNKLQWQSITWSTRQDKRYGSCTPVLQTMRISHRIATMPHFVKAYVVMHELAHLLEANHGPRFWKLVNQYPHTERARGYLMAVGLEELDDPHEANQ